MRCKEVNPAWLEGWVPGKEGQCEKEEGHKGRCCFMIRRREYGAGSETPIRWDSKKEKKGDA